jgi:tetratricopeptide (TPR) repeat protein
VFLNEVDRFLESHDFSATVTYNGKSFDFPLLEARYILQRKRFPLLKLPHLDFLFPARTLWKHTYDSRKLGHLGDILLGLSRDDDVDASQIPGMYFNYLRSRSFFSIEKVVEHNALDLVGLAALVLLAVKYQEDIAFTHDEGEILGTAKLYEKYGDFEKALQLYELLKQSALREEIVTKAVKSLAVIKKKKKLYKEALQLWEILSHSDANDRLAVRELSVYFEHREKNYVKALEYVRKGLNSMELTEPQQRDFEKRLKRLTRKIEALDKVEDKP